MLNYDFMIEAYQQVLKKNENDSNIVEHMNGKLAAFRLLNGRTEDEIYNLFNTGAFNDIVYSYVKSAIGNAGYAKYKNEILEELRFLFGAVGSKEICEAHENAEN